MGKRHKNRRPVFTPLASQKRVGSRLQGPLSTAGSNIELVDWLRDLLPEHLWLAALADGIGMGAAVGVYNAFMDALDEFWTHKFVALGLLSDFGLLSRDERASFLQKNSQLVDEYFHRPLGRILSLYPDNPAFWLTNSKLLESEGSVDPFVELARMRRLVTLLAPGKDQFAGRIRAIPLNRLFKHNKLFVAKGLAVIDLLPKYPMGLTDEELFLVESFARSTIRITIEHREQPDLFAWSKYFWRHNYDLLPCQPVERKVVGGNPVGSENAQRLTVCLQGNAIAAREYLQELRAKLRLDLYDPSHGEVLFGLFARLTRLYVLMVEDPYLWARDVSGIMLRPLAETAITFSYLCKAGSTEDFKRFIEYGEGQQKLLMLHLQDHHPDERSLEGQSSEQVAEEIDIWPELVDIELGSWSKKDARRLARDAGLEDFYRLVFSPASSDLHGSWLSLKSSNLVRCAEPLHRWHRLPTFSEPPFFVNTAIAAQAIYLRCREVAIMSLGYPPGANLQDLTVDESPRDSKNFAE